MYQYGCFSLKKELLEEWFKYMWNAYKSKSIERREISRHANPPPSLPEQRRIVACLNVLQAEVDALMPAVLDRAFKGEL